MKSELSNWYRTKFDQLAEDPPKDIWESISNELDTEEVWENINLELQRKSRIRSIKKNLSYSGVFLLLFGGGIFFFYHQTKSVKTLPVAQYPWVDSKIKVFNTNNQLSYFKANDSHDKKVGLFNPNIISSHSSEKIKLVTNDGHAYQNLKKDKEQRKKGKFSLVKYNSDPAEKQNSFFFLNEITPTMDSTGNSKNVSMALFDIHPIQSFLSEKKDSIDNSIELVCLPKEGDVKNLIIGTTFIYSNSWLFNNDTYEGFSKNNLNQTNLSFGNSYAVLLGYDLSNYSTVQAEWSINNKQEQDYVRYYEGKQVQKKIIINYTYFDLLLKKKEPKLVFKKRIPVSLNYIAGIQYSYLKSVSRMINGNTRSVKNRYRKDNYSLVVGVEYQLTVKHLWVISSGLRADIGLRNIYAGNGVTPASFNRTYNSSIGLNVGINYTIPIKNKN